MADCEVQRLVECDVQSMADENEELSTVGYDVNCCGVMVNRGGEIVEDMA